MPVVAIVDKSPEQVMHWLIKNKGEDKVTFVPQSGFLREDGKYRKYIFVVGTKEYDRNATTIRALEDHIVFVFGNERLLKYYGLDVVSDLDSLEPVRAKLVPIGNYLEDLRKKAIANSLLHSLMTFIYTLPSKTHQKPVTSAICLWVYGDGDASLEDFIGSLPVKISPLNKHKLMKILGQPVTQRLRSAFADLRSGECETHGEAVLKHDVQIFELGYIEGNVKKIDNIVDLKVGNQGV